MTKSPSKLKGRHRSSDEVSRDDDVADAEISKAEEMKQVRQAMKMKSLQRHLFNLIEKKYGEESTLQPIERSVDRVTAKILGKLTSELSRLKEDRLKREDDCQRVRELMTVAELTSEEALFLADKGVLATTAGAGVLANGGALMEYFTKKELMKRYTFLSNKARSQPKNKGKKSKRVYER